MDTVAKFKAAVTQYGGGVEKRVVSLIFNNAYVKTFNQPEVFSYAEHLDETNEYFKFMEKDTRGVPYMVLKPVMYLEGIVFAENDEDVERLDKRYIRS
jgi:hypothetical protein